MIKHIILVAGYEYHHGRTNIATICKRRANYLVHQNPSWQNDNAIKFTLFDVRFGRIDKGNISNRRINWTVENDSFEAINDATHYNSDRHFVQANTNVISMTNVYEYIQNIGIRNPHSILEFSILGHGWRGGPVLVNSYQRDIYNINGSKFSERDPWDKDGRKKDTNVTNMNDTVWRNFKNAFANDSHIWIWGCAASRLYKKVIQQVINSSNFKSKSYGTQANIDTYSFSFTQDFANTYFTSDSLFFFRTRNAQPITNRTFTRTLAEVKDFLIRGLSHTYAAQMAYNTNIKVYASLPGTGSDYEKEVNRSRSVMVVPTNSSIYGYSFNQIVRFFKTFTPMQEDPEHRGYAFYDPDVIKNWKHS